MENVNYLSIANSPIFWVLCSITVLISFVQALLFIRQAKKMSAKAKLDPTLPNRAFRIGMISAIGPACGVFIVMVGLMASIGGPMAWLRLSIIGAAATELSAASMGAQAAGVEFGGEGYTLTIMAVSWFAMALNGAGWLIVSGTCTPMLEKIRAKVSGGDAKWLIVLSGACSIGIFGYLCANEIVKGMGNTIAALAGALSMMAIVKFIVPKYPKLAEYSLGIAMIIGMACAVCYDMMAV